MRKTSTGAQRLSALKEWSVLMCQPLVWEPSVEPVLLDTVEMGKSALVSWDMTCMPVIISKDLFGMLQTLMSA